MPQVSQNLSVPQRNSSELLLFACETFQRLKWTIEFVTEDRLVGYSKKMLGSYYDHIIVDVENEALTITSKLPESAAFDILSRNKKNVSKFTAGFDEVKAAATPQQMEQWKSTVGQLQQKTTIAAEEQTKEMQQVEAVMNLSSGSKIITYGIIGINVFVFIAMCVSGISLTDPSTQELANWGGNYKPFTTNGDWWRLLTNIFVHAGIIHIAFNMFVLYMAGNYLEPMLGKIRYAAAYLCTGILASVCSIWWHGDDIVSVGASGAIFGMYGVFLALLTTKLIPNKMRNALLQSIGIFIFYNLAYGASKSGVDNAAHVGGILSGFVIGYIYFLSLKNPQKLKAVTVSVGILVATIAIVLFYLQSQQS